MASVIGIERVMVMRREASQVPGARATARRSVAGPGRSAPRYTRQVANELFDALMQFHREVVQPQFDGIRLKVDSLPSREELNEALDSVRAEMATKAELQAVRSEMATKSDLLGVEQSLRGELQTIRKEMVTWPVLIRFHEYVIHPEIDDVRSKLSELATRDDVFTQVDGLYVHLGRLNAEYHALTAAVRRIDIEMKQGNANMESLRAEMFEMRKQILDLGERVTRLETILN
jgi:chromosome segregation ATPase